MRDFISFVSLLFFVLLLYDFPFALDLLFLVRLVLLVLFEGGLYNNSTICTGVSVKLELNLRLELIFWPSLDRSSVQR